MTPVKSQEHSTTMIRASTAGHENTTWVSSAPVSRRLFLKTGIRLLALGFLGGTAAACTKAGIPHLRGISAQQYINIRQLGEFFLQELPIPDFDIGLALDDFLFGTVNKYPPRDLILDLVNVPSSVLASLYFDQSLRPLSSLDAKERASRLLAWRESRQALPRGVYKLMHSLCMSLASNQADYLRMAGYAE